MTTTRPGTSTDRERARELAARRGGVFRISDLVAAGIDPGIARTMCRRGWWTRLRHGVYADTSTLAAADTREQRTILHTAAALAAIPSRAAAIGPSSALIHSLPVERRLTSAVHLVRPRDTDQRALKRRVSSPTSLSGCTVHRHRIEDEDLETVGGILTVRRDLAGLTTASMSSPDWAVATLDGVLWQQPLHLDRLRALADQWTGVRGIGVVRAALPHVRSGAQTPLESLSRLRLLRAGIPEPVLQSPVRDQRGLIGYVDMEWVDWGVVGEADGALKYQARGDLIAEKIREDRIRATGRAVVRWTWAEIMRDPDAIADRILGARGSAARRAG